MVGPKLQIGPTHALRLVLEKHGALDSRSLLARMHDEHGVGQMRAWRALRRALSHGQVVTAGVDCYQKARGSGQW